jgi:E3 ubiquitin-protein ligase SHPRH
LAQEEEDLAKGVAHHSDQHATNSIYSDISSGELKEIKNVDLDGSYGTKIDTLARQIIWLRGHDPGSKSIIFSQYKNFLGILDSAFRRFKIKTTSIDAKRGIEDFKTDPTVSPFLPLSFLLAVAHFDLGRMLSTAC